MYINTQPKRKDHLQGKAIFPVLKLNNISQSFNSKQNYEQLYFTQLIILKNK